MDDFLVRAFVAGLGVAIVAGPMGCFVVWRRMAYFGDTLAHGSLLGIAGALALAAEPAAGILAAAGTIALLLSLLERQRTLARDTMLGILAHSALAFGLVALSFMESVRVDLMAYLFGDILAVTVRDLALIWAGGIAVLGLLAWQWRPLLALTVHEDLARVEGANPTVARIGYTLMLAAAIAVALKIVGVLLVTSLLIIPAAAARRLARTPEGMAAMAALIGAISVAAGLWASLQWNTPAGPSIVGAAAVIFVVLWTVPIRRMA